MLAGSGLLIAISATTGAWTMAALLVASLLLFWWGWGPAEDSHG